jgi:hypothetical protein
MKETKLNFGRIAKYQKSLQSQLDLILARYNADENTIDCKKMNDSDYELYLSIDNAIQTLKEIRNQ